jgi:hypothetical protein
MWHSTLARQLSGGLLAAVVFACAFAPRVHARQAKTFDFAELERAVEAELQAGHTPGAAVAVVIGERVVYAKGFGVTSAEEGGAAVAHAPQTWEVFVKDGKLFLKEDGKDFQLTKLGRERFGYEQGEVLFVPDATGAIERIFMGLYAARRTQ